MTCHDLDDTGCIPAGTDFLLGGLEMFGDIMRHPFVKGVAVAVPASLPFTLTVSFSLVLVLVLVLVLSPSATVIPNHTNYGWIWLDCGPLDHVRSLETTLAQDHPKSVP